MREAYSYRQDPSVPAFPDERPIVVFDGHCAFCSGWARLILHQDRAAHYRLLAAQSALGHALYEHYGLDPTNYETNMLIVDGVAWFKSEGSIKMAEGLGFPWSLAAILRVFPLRIRDTAYEFIARNRMKLFGRRDTCYMPTSDYKNRFLG